MITALPRVAIATRDFDGALRHFRDTLGMPVVDLSSYSVPNLGAKLAMCVPPGGSNVELMSPADPAAPLAQSLERFLARRGEGLFALMLEAPDPDAEAAVLRARGLDVLPLMAGASGRDVHPRSTHGVLIRVYPSRSFVAEPGQIQRNEARALGLSGIVRVVLAVRDVKAACETYGRRLALAADEPIADAARGVLAARCAAPSGGSIELVEAVDPSRLFAAAIHGHLERSGEGMFALVATARDPLAAARELAGRGVAVRPPADGLPLVELDPTGCFGARVWIEPDAGQR